MASQENQEKQDRQELRASSVPPAGRATPASTASQEPPESEVPRARSDPWAPLDLEAKWDSPGPRENRGCKDLRDEWDSRAPPCPYREDWDGPASTTPLWARTGSRAAATSSTSTMTSTRWASPDSLGASRGLPDPRAIRVTPESEVVQDSSACEDRRMASRSRSNSCSRRWRISGKASTFSMPEFESWRLSFRRSWA